MIVHVCQSTQPDTIVVCPLGMIDFSAVVGIARAVVDLMGIALVEDAIREPVPLRLRPFRVRLVASVSRQSRRQLEEPAVADHVLVIVSAVPGEDLPPQSTITRAVVPSSGLLIEDGLTHGYP